MLDRTRDYLAELDTHIEHLNSEVGHWTLVREALAHTLERPDPGQGVPPAIRVPAPDQPGSDRTGPRERSTTAGRAPRGRSTSASGGTPTPASHPCPDCDRTFKTPAARGSHRRTHFAKGMARAQAATEPQPVRGESFLCGRCSRSFLSRLARDQHETQAECHPLPTREPAVPVPFVINTKTRAGGMGE